MNILQIIILGIVSGATASVVARKLDKKDRDREDRITIRRQGDYLLIMEKPKPEPPKSGSKIKRDIKDEVSPEMRKKFDEIFYMIFASENDQKNEVKQMKEYIDKSALIERVNLNYNNHQNVSACAVKDMIKTTLTVTEAEIRAKEVNAFADWVYENFNKDLTDYVECYLKAQRKGD